jgi:hypothetical protein
MANTRHVFGPPVDAAMQKENVRRYGRPQQDLGGTLLTRTTGLSPADRALVAEGAPTGSELLSYTVPPEVSDTMVAVPYLMRRLTREANRQAQERMQRREAEARLKAGCRRSTLRSRRKTCTTSSRG